MQERKWQGRTSGGNLGQRGLIFLVRCLPIRIVYVILHFAIPFYMLFARKGRNAIYSFFRRRVGYSPCKAIVATYRNHYIFGQTLLDKFAVFAGKSAFFELEIEGEELLSDIVSQPKGILFAGAHVGNFEIVGYLLKTDRKPVNAIVYGGETAVVQINRSKIFNENRLKLIPISDDMSHIFMLSSAAEKGEIISVLCDRYMNGNKSVELEFMGTKAHFPLGTFVLANRYDMNVLSVFVLKESYKKYKVIINKLEGASAKELTQQYAASLEQVVKAYPHQWFNFYTFFNEQP